MLIQEERFTKDLVGYHRRNSNSLSGSCGPGMKRLIISSLLLLVVGCEKNEELGYSEQEMIYGLKTHGVRRIEKDEEGYVWLVSFPSTFDLDLDEPPTPKSPMPSSCI